MLNETQTESIVNCDFHLKKIIRAYFNSNEYGHDEECDDSDYFVGVMNGNMLYFLNGWENYTWQGGDSSALEKRCPDLTEKNLYSYDHPSCGPYDQTKFLWKQMTTSQKF